MIKSETEYKAALLQLKEQELRLKTEERKLREASLSKTEIKRALDPVRCLHEQLQEEIASYERLRRGDFDEIQNFAGMGNLLIALRISQGLSQRELAHKLGVHESQVSRDERNEYHGITLERANRILDVLGVELRSSVARRRKAKAMARQD